MGKTGTLLNWWSFLVLSSVILLGLSFLLTNSLKPPCANSISCSKNLTGEIQNQNKGVFMGKQVYVPNNLMAYEPKNTKVLGQSTAIKRIDVDLTHQRLYAFEGEKMVMNFPISSGKWYPTPTGTFRIWVKLRATRMTGGNSAIGTYYDLPNVPWTMFFSNDQITKERGFSLHGAYWHNNFGHPMSHGCVNISPENAHRLYDWAEPATNSYTTYATNDNPGTMVVIYGTPPAE